jgi:glutaconate CoA-transferase, subunit B
MTVKHSISSMKNEEYSSNELMIINAARMLTNGDIVFVGVGLPNLACNLAKHTHAPELIMIYESGVIDASPSRLPLSIGDPALVSGALSVVGMYDVFAYYLQHGKVDVGFLGGAQVDKYGNINTTIIGADYSHPHIRLPGSGGAQEIAAWADRCYVISPHEKRRFPEKVDFITSRGCQDSDSGRENSQVRGKGPFAVITDIGILEPDPTGELILIALHPGKTLQSAIENTGWNLKSAEILPTTSPVTRTDLKILRTILKSSGIS